MGMRHSIFKNLGKPKPQHPFAIGFGDDVADLSLKHTTRDTVPAGTAQGVLYGFGSDATVAANKNALELIARETELPAPGYFAYDALKAGSITCSFLRCGPMPTKSCYEITAGAKYVGIHKKEYVKSLSAESTLSCLKPGGILVPHSPWVNPELLKQNLSLSVRQYMSAANTVLENNDKVVLLDTSSFCGGDSSKATSGITGAETKTQKAKGIDDTITLFTNDTLKGGAKKPELVKVLCGNSGADVDWLVEKFNLDLSLVARLGGHSAPRTHRGAERFPGMTITYALIQMVEKVAERSDKARIITKTKVTKLLTSGNACVGCSYEKGGQVFHEMGPVTPATGGFGEDFTRNFFLASNEAPKKAPGSRDVREATGSHQMAGLGVRIQASAMDCKDCMGCEVCVTTCPDNALKMTNMKDVIAGGHRDNWNYAMALPDRNGRSDKSSIKGPRFNQPLLEFSGAREGCSETPYAKPITQFVRPAHDRCEHPRLQQHLG